MYSCFEQLPRFDPGTPFDEDKMPISLMGSEVPPVTRSQQLMSTFVQAGVGGGGTSTSPKSGWEDSLWEAPHNEFYVERHAMVTIAVA